MYIIHTCMYILLIGVQYKYLHCTYILVYEGSMDLSAPRAFAGSDRPGTSISDRHGNLEKTTHNLGHKHPSVLLLHGALPSRSRSTYT